MVPKKGFAPREGFFFVFCFFFFVFNRKRKEKEWREKRNDKPLK